MARALNIPAHTGSRENRAGARVPVTHPAGPRRHQPIWRALRPMGHPVLFHAESGTRMGIPSAGPDKKMWTADDIVLTP